MALLLSPGYNANQHLSDNYSDVPKNAEHRLFWRSTSAFNICKPHSKEADIVFFYPQLPITWKGEEDD